MATPGLLLLQSLHALDMEVEAHPLDHMRWTPPQLAYLQTAAQIKLLRTGNQFGKGHSIGTSILTPGGWRPIGSLQVGDQVIAGDGSATTVTGVFPRGRLPLLRFVFDDGASVDCTYDHLWVVRDHTARFHRESPRYGQWRVMEAQDILDRWGPNPRAPYRVSIPVMGRSDLERVLHHIEGAGEDESVCISVAHPSQTYVTEDYIVTHNTVSGAAETIWRCLGDHPYLDVPPPPIEAWIITKSWSQSIAIQGKLWDLLPKDELAPDVRFTAKNGFRGVQKAVEFKNGSIIRIKTIGQDTLDLASATIHYVWIDEPLGDSRTFSELQMRLRRTGGQIGITMTPATAGDLVWLRTMVDEGKVADLHFRMEPQNFIPHGASRPFRTEEGVLMDAAWIQDQVESTLPWERGVRCHGEWEFRAVDRVYDAYKPDIHAIPNLLQSDVRPRGEVKVLLGIDWGEDALRTCASLLYVDDSGQHPKIYVVGEYAPTTKTTVDMDAKGILAMLSALGVRWSDLDEVWSDSKYKGRTEKKNAKVLLQAVAHEMGLRDDPRPLIRVAKRRVEKEHLWPSVRWLYSAMVRPGHFFLDPTTCSWTHEALQKWDGTAKHPAKDILDGLRYALRSYWGRKAQRISRRLYRTF